MLVMVHNMKGEKKMNKKILLPAILIPVVLVILVVVIVLVATAGGPYNGRVTYAGKGLGNVSVSDGRHVVKTDKDGNFTLKGYRKTRFITVTAPAGYTTEQYYLKADKKQHDGYEFELQKSEIAAGQAHKFLQISDTEIGEDGVGDWINYLNQIAADEKPAFLIHTGDICYVPGLKRHLSDMNTENMGVPVRYIIGNHDYVEGKYGEELFESIYGPVWYSFEVGNVHYIVTPFQVGGDYKSGYNKNDRWRWLENDLKNTDENMKVVMFNHNKPDDDYVIRFDRKELDLKKHNLIAWVFGHYHYNYTRENNGVVDICTARPDCGGIDSSVSGARMVNIAADGTVSTKMRYDGFAPNQGKVTGADWSTRLPGNVLFCNTEAGDGRVYVGTVDDDYPKTGCGVFCLDGKNGKILWQYKTENSVKNNLVLTDSTVVAQDCLGNVYCLDRSTGKEVWKTAVNLSSSLGTSTGICADDRRVYTGCAAAVTALDLATGKVVWENDRGHGEASPAEFVLAGDKLLVNSHWDALVALDKTTGKQLWENKDEDIRFRSSTPVQVDDSTLLVADSDAIMLVDLNSGDITTKKDYDDKYNFSSSAQPVVKDGVAYIPTVKEGLVLFDLSKEEITKTVEVGKALLYTAPYTNTDAMTIEPTLLLAADGTLVFGASDGVLYTINPDGSVTDKRNIGAPIFGRAAELDGKYIVSDFAGRVSALPVK